MALFGTSRKKQLWDVINGMGTDPYPGTPPIHDPSEHPTDPTEVAQEYDPSGAASPPPQKRGFFGAGGVGRGIAGSIGDFLLQQAHMAPVYAPAMQQQREMDMRMQQYQQQRQATMADWKTQQEYEAAHRPPDLPEPVKLANYYRSMGRDDLASAVEAKSAAMSGTNAAGQPVVMNPSSLFPPPGQQQPQSKGMFVPGQVINGMRFKGGDEEDPNNYEPENGGPSGSTARAGFLRRR